MKYDERGNVIEVSFYGVDRKPILVADGYAKIENKYDERGNIIKSIFYGINGKPLPSKSDPKPK
jgi:hypothetical protein